MGAISIQSIRPDPANVLTKALLRAAEQLSITQGELADAIGISHATMSRIARGERVLDASSKEFELASLLVRVFRSMDALLGGNLEQSRLWFNAYNHHLKQAPKDSIKSITGLVQLVHYLDAMRGKI